jgi:hypothetical protein
MALLWIDGFDAYGTDGQDVTSLMEQSGYIQQGPYGSFTAKSATEDGIGYSLSIAYPGSLCLPFGNSAGVCCGFRVVMFSASGQIVCFRYNNLMGNIYTQLRVWLDGQNGIAVGTQDGDLIASSPVSCFLENVWYYLEIYYVPHLTSGTIKIKIDGIEVINVSGVKTACSASPSTTLVNQIVFATENNGITHQVISGGGYYDDFYLEDLTGTGFNSFLGDCVVHTVFPGGDEGPNTMSQVGGSTGHYTSVDDNPMPDDDTSYVHGSSSGLKELYTVTTLPADILDVLAVSVNVRAKKSSVGQADYVACYVYNGVEVDSQTFSAPASYVETHALFVTPPGGGAWNLTLVQNSFIGFAVP